MTGPTVPAYLGAVEGPDARVESVTGPGESARDARLGGCPT